MNIVHKGKWVNVNKMIEKNERFHGNLAISAAEAGYCVRRDTWPEGCYVMRVDGGYIDNGFVNEDCYINPFFVKKTEDETFDVWVWNALTTDDLFSKDWSIYDE